MVEPLRKLAGYDGPVGPVVLVIMDGIGIGRHPAGDMVRAANKPNLDWLAAHSITDQLQAHGVAVGMPSNADMGNSEVGHNAIGCGRVFAQGARLVNEAIANGRLFRGGAWRDVIEAATRPGAQLHFIGLLSDGNVHSHLDHLIALLRAAKLEGVRRVRVHVLLDGRDVPPTSALTYVDQIEAVLAELNADRSVDYAIASGGGRMKVTMDRYEANWNIVETGWRAHVWGEAEAFPSARAAIEAMRARSPGIIDQDLPAFVIHREGVPVGPVRDGDAVVLFNFRGDRAIEISRAFEEETFDKFPRGPRPNVVFAGMMEYDGDLHIPKRYLVEPPAIDRTVGEYFVASGVRQLACSETQKYGHVTYFFNGNRSGKFSEEFEDYVEVPSDRVPFEERPWMKAAEITDVVVQAIRENRHRFIRLNYANGDMVGHTGVLPAVRIAVEAVDLCIGRLIRAIRAARGILVVSADHGNADDMVEIQNGEPVVDPGTGELKIKTSHSLNPVPVYVYDPTGVSRARRSAATGLGISSLAATCMKLLGFEPPEDYTPSVMDVGDGTGGS